MDRGENFEGSDNESEVGRTYHNPPMLTQEAAGVLAGFGAVYNNNNNILIPSNFQQERDQQTADLNAVMGLDITFENEESGNNEVAIGASSTLGFRGQDEIVYSKWSQFEITKYKSGPDQGLRKVEAHIKDGYDKSNNLKLGNTAPCEHKPEIREDPNNIHCWVKLLHDNITRTTWYYPKNAIGKTKIRAMVKEAAETAGFLDWAKFTAHRNRDRMVTATVSNTNVTSKASLAQARHGNAKSQDPYNHNTAVQKHHLQNALLGGIHGNGGLQTNHKSSTNTSLKNENDDDEKENKPIINDNNNKKDTQLTKQLSSPTKDQYRMQLAAATTTHEQDAQRLEKRKHKRDDYKQQRNDYKQQNKKLKSDLTKIEHELSIELQRSKSNDDAHAVEGKQLKSKIGMLELNYSNMKEAMKIERRENNALVEQLEGKESEITSLQQQLQQKATDSKQQATDLKQQAIDSKQQATNIVSLQQQLSNAQQQQMLLMMQQQNHGSCTIM
ncbi:hypothetical protein FRACYDRAFT_258535 [Fragilariopsis cylindrus CCMP1102]|uniref:Uncharacterized protein n=1 Tax=Fragilariopsis cylindrus CCMP1102 TaxID=635003 RepID=A0A1E7EIM2_9STRA|nr:hypothetical protein FRACYDRAFT_258535 [Fragilariopsis cylindrus CCMP1102]|eukprot:OEU05720.1 hypothetical protein FRACYDRAFT_258535 [Fragilariopsis cylindrus CCMP1102]